MIKSYDEFISEAIQLGGKSLLLTFMKCLTALGQKNNQPALEFTSKDFLLFYDFKDIDSQMVRGVFGRFKSLAHFADLINYDHNKISLYFGIRCNGIFEYGVRDSEQLKPIGNFKLNQSGINSLTRLESLSATSIKKELVNLTPKDILLLGIIKSEFYKFNPGYFNKQMVPVLKDKMLTFGLSGLGRWENGKLSPEDEEKFTAKFKQFLSTYKWCDKVMVRVKSDDNYWVKFYVKLK